MGPYLFENSTYTYEMLQNLTIFYFATSTNFTSFIFSKLITRSSDQDEYMNADIFSRNSN